MCLLISGVWFIELETQVPLSDETDAALVRSDPVVRERAECAGRGGGCDEDFLEGVHFGVSGRRRFRPNRTASVP